jgi:hypothetical protein
MKKITSIALVSVLLVSCSSPEKAQTPEAKETREASAKSAKRDASMQALARTVSEFLPLISSRSKFSDPNNGPKIEKDTVALRDLAHGLGDMTSSGDPGQKVVQEYFSEDLSRALEAYRSGQTEYARHVLKDTTGYCIQCHTYSDTNKTGPRINLDLSATELTPLERAEFYAATRQNDRALEAYTKALSDKSTVEKNPFEWEVSARTALALTISRDLNPKQAAKLVDQIAKNPQIPKATIPTVKSWKKSVTEWAKAPKTPKTAKEKLSAAAKLVGSAQKRQEFPLDHSQDVLYFRASSLLHDSLQDPSLTKQERADALYWSGVAAEATRDMNFWTLHETYYEQCIRLVPKTPRAKECFARLRDSIVLGYSGSAGTNIPPAQQKRLDSFATLAIGSD